jgi:hypothetical protein
MCQTRCSWPNLVVYTATATESVCQDCPERKQIGRLWIANGSCRCERPEEKRSRRRRRNDFLLTARLGLFPPKSCRKATPYQAQSARCIHHVQPRRRRAVPLARWRFRTSLPKANRLICSREGSQHDVCATRATLQTVANRMRSKPTVFCPSEPRRYHTRWTLRMKWNSIVFRGRAVAKGL